MPFWEKLTIIKISEMFNLSSCILVVLIALLCIKPYSSCGMKLTVATTTSIENSALLYEILPHFEKRFNIKVTIIAVGTGKALKLAENGDVDAVLVHSTEAEEEFIKKGFGVNPRMIMYNDFVIVGPASDPAQIKELIDATEALRNIAIKKANFVSRGDESGTHKKEKSLWIEANVVPTGKWYIETGQGMGITLQIADEKRAYCLTDRATFVTYRKKIELVVLSEGDERLYNPYRIIAVNPYIHPHVNYNYAITLINWITSTQVKKLIVEYKKDGEILFHPYENKMEVNSGAEK